MLDITGEERTRKIKRRYVCRISATLARYFGLVDCGYSIMGCCVNVNTVFACLPLSSCGGYICICGEMLSVINGEPMSYACTITTMKLQIMMIC